MLAVENINYQHKSFKILDTISFDAKAGKMIAIVGPNGAGKSSLLSYIANEIEPNANLIRLKDISLKNWKKEDLPQHKAKFSQHQPTDIPLTVKEVVLMGRYPYFQNSPQQQDIDAVDYWMTKTDINHLKDRDYIHLSGGEKQRVHLARVFVQLENEVNQKLLLLDEPLNNLDVSHQFNLLEILNDFKQKGNLVILVMHDLNLASQFADEVILMNKGKIVYQDSPEKVFRPEIISKIYRFPCTICKNPIDQKPLILFGKKTITMNTLTDLKQQWEDLKANQPKIRIRNAAKELGVSEMEILATQLGDNVTKLKPEFAAILQEIESLGKVMALTRNNECVHERKGIYLNPDFSSPHAQLFVGEDIDMRIFLNHWKTAFAVVEKSEHGERKSLQFFGKDGEAIHKIYLVPQSNVEAFDALVEKYKDEDQQTIPATEIIENNVTEKPDNEIDVEGFQQAWVELKDTHNFFTMLRKFGVTRTQALRLAPTDYHAKQISNEAIVKFLEKSAETQTPIMVFTGNKGNIQIHTGEIKRTMWHENWFNILDPDFNMHLDMSKIASTWIVRKPTEDGIVTAIEVFNDKGEIIVQFFGKRKPGIPELEQWREIVAELN